MDTAPGRAFRELATVDHSAGLVLGDLPPPEEGIANRLASPCPGVAPGIGSRCEPAPVPVVAPAAAGDRRAVSSAGVPGGRSRLRSSSRRSSAACGRGGGSSGPSACASPCSNVSTSPSVARFEDWSISEEESAAQREDSRSDRRPEKADRVRAWLGEREGEEAEGLGGGRAERDTEPEGEAPSRDETGDVGDSSEVVMDSVGACRVDGREPPDSAEERARGAVSAVSSSSSSSCTMPSPAVATPSSNAAATGVSMPESSGRCSS